MADAEAEDGRLAAALLDDVPQALASPGAWRQLFFAKHADAAVFAGLFTACTAGRDCAVTTAPSMTVKLKLTKYRCEDDVDALRQAWLKKVNVVQGALTTRGALPTKLLVVLPSGGWEDADDIALFQALQGKHVTAFHVRPKQFYGLSRAAQEQASRLLHLATSAFKQSLVTLYLNIDLPFPRELTPKHLPHLRNLVIKTFWYQADNSFKPGFAYVNIHPFLPQLRSLRGDIRKAYEVQHRGFSPCQELFWRHNKRTHSLTKFTTNDPLDSVDLRLLLDCAPNLSYLGSPIADDIADFSKEKWPVGELGKECTLSTLLRLPGQRAGKLRVTVGCLLLIVEAEGLSATVASRLSDWHIQKARDIRMSPFEQLPEQRQAYALCQALRQLHELTAPNNVIDLTGWCWAPEMLEHAWDIMRGLRRLRFRIFSAEPLPGNMASRPANCGVLVHQ